MGGYDEGDSPTPTHENYRQNQSRLQSWMELFQFTNDKIICFWGGPFVLAIYFT